MFKVIQPFFDGKTHCFYSAGLEIADDPALAFAEARGLIVRMEEEKPQTEVKEEKAVKKTPAKKKTTKKAIKK